MKLYNADCLEILRGMESNTVDAIITDPPAGINFMNKEFDSLRGGSENWINWLSEIMVECLRVIKPGGHMLCWALPRTSWMTGAAIDKAGWEIRDVICHVFGSGFPKSKSIPLQIDKMNGYPNRGHRVATANRYHPDGTFESNGENLPAYEPITEAAKKWEGWGSAIKPATEHWYLARKPLGAKNVAENVLKWGVGGINVDACRVPMNDEWKRIHRGNAKISNSIGKESREIGSVGENNPKGRFPPNLLLTHSLECNNGKCVDGCPVKELGEQSGFGESNAHYRKPGIDKYGFTSPHEGWGFTDSGTAARFFPQFHYFGKASPTDRNEGADNGHPTVKALELMVWLCKLITPPGGVILDPFMGSGSTGCAAVKLGFDFIGIEKEKEYYEIAKRRIQWAKEPNGQMRLF